jgi:DNA helicase-2/ATP-dependent DNA helicase PcrA
MIKGIERNVIPVSLTRDGIYNMPRLLPETAFDIGMQPGKEFIHMVPHDLELTAKSTNKALGKRLSVMYEIHVFTVKSSVNDEFKDLMQAQNNENCYTTNFSDDPVGYLKNIASGNTNINPALMDDYIANYSLYDGTCEILDFTYDHVLDYIEHVVINYQSYVRSILVAMEHFNFPIETYSDLYTIMQKHMSQADIDAVKECNTNLMTVAALQALKSQKTNLTTFPAKPLNQNSPRKYSPLQEAAILDNDPLVLVQSGAGTGKSTVVLGRINHMIDCGVKPKDIIVLSFTNAAADHISDLYPDIRSMTIASMIHSIYSANFPTHMLSSENTLLNMLEATIPETAERKELCRYLRKGDRMGISEFTAMYNFVSANYQPVIQMLTIVAQTTLLLEVLICAIDMQNIKIPKELTCKHMIVDEVQDNSMFEFIYMLKYTAYNHNSLFMVGDCSQTLYEFRLANPGTLNTLEASGIFNTHVLDINYRSTQAILDFANIVLANIAANRYANIQLRANSLATVDYNTFINTVHCEYRQLKKKADLSDALPGIFAQQNVAAFINNAIANKEKLAILSYSRATAARCKEIMEIQHPQAKCTSACSRVTYDITILSNYVAHHWDSVKYFNMQTLLHDICGDLISRYSNANAVSAQDVRNRDTIQKFGAATQQKAASWYQMYAVNGVITKDEYIEKFKDALVEFEISNNTYRRRITSAINKQEKESDDIANADIIVSTVHSVKGLEYDHVIVIYDDEADDEASKRLYYVALTRAMKSEYILGYGTRKYSNITDWYNNIANSLNPSFVSKNTTVQISQDGSAPLQSMEA